MGMLMGCGAPPTQRLPSEPPFTAEQIRQATPEGRRYRYRIEQPGKPAFIQLIEFVKIDSQGATLRQRSLSATDDAPEDPEGETAQARVTWRALEERGRSSAANTHVVDARITVPAGTFDCMRYTIRKGRVVTRSWFAHRLPGAPIRQEVMRDGTRAFGMILLDHAPAIPPFDQ